MTNSPEYFHPRVERLRIREHLRNHVLRVINDAIDAVRMHHWAHDSCRFHFAVASHSTAGGWPILAKNQRQPRSSLSSTSAPAAS